MLLLWIINVALITCAVLGENGSKRLLLNDLSITNDRLNRLENMLLVLNNTQQQMKSKNVEQEKEIQLLTVTNKQQVSIIQQQSASIHQQSASFQQQSVSNQQFTTSIQNQKVEIDNLKQQLHDTIQHVNDKGSIYVRWGRKQCPSNGTEQVYSGFAAGGIHTDQGSAAEFVCLPPDPNFIKTKGSDYGRMFGAEYDSNFFKSNANGEDIPCSVCRTQQATTSIMISGKSTCYAGWNREFYGYLASGYHGNNVATSYICIDINPEYVMGGVENRNEKYAGEVVAKCGALKCPPYINNYPLTCVVCSK